MRYLIAVGVSCVLMMTPAQSLAGRSSKPFDGTWQLDAKASQSLDPILKGMGYGWFSRKVMGTLAVRQVIQSRPSGIAFRVLTRFTDDTIVLPTDNRWAIGRTIDGGQTQRRSRWLKNEPVLVTEDRFKTGLLTTVRRRVNQGTFHEELKFEAAGKAAVTAVRVFRRKGN